MQQALTRSGRDDGIRDIGDREALARVRAGETAAFEAIMRRYNRRLFRIARAILRDDAEAEDAVQETYLRAFDRLGDFVGPDGLGAWLGRIATNEALGRLRRRGRVVLLADRRAARRDGQAPEASAMTDDDPFGPTADPGPDPERLAASGELRGLLEAAIDRLAEPFRTVFVLRAVEQLSVAETAASLGIAPETVKTRYHRARLQIRRTLDATIAREAGSLFPFAGARCDRIVARVLARLSERP